MGVRRPQVLNAAVAVLARGGDRALTYRTVDAAAGVPSGTTSNYFRTRAALLLAVATHTERQRRRVFDDLFEQHAPASAGQLVKMLEAYLVEAASGTSTAGILARAHTALLPLALDNPELAGLLANSHQLHTGALHRELVAINPSSSPRLAALIVDYLTGTLVNQHATGATDASGLIALIELLDLSVLGR